MSEPASAREKVGATLSATAVGLAGIFAITAWEPVLVAIAGVNPADPPVAVSTIAVGFGTVSVAAVYLAAGDLGREYLDLSAPTLRGAGYVVGGTLLLVVLNVAVNWALSVAGVDVTTHTIIRQAESNPGILLVQIPLSYLVVAPGEELLFRNVVQKSLYDAFSKRAAVLVASAVFALAHVGSYLQADSLLATLGSLVSVLALSFVLGGIYARTENLAIPILVHATFNALAFATAYLRLT